MAQGFSYTNTRQNSNGSYEQTFLDIKEQPNKQGGQHPFNNPKNHENLLCYCKDRLNLSKSVLGELRNRMSTIDVKLSGFMALDEQDKMRENDNLRGKEVKPTKQSNQFAMVQLGRGVTYLVSVFAPDSGLYEAVASKDDQAFANAVTKVMNDQSIKGKYFREFCKFFLCTLKYNLGAMLVEWEIEKGQVLANDPQNPDQPTVQDQVTWQGNIVTALDMYNVGWDPSVNPCDAHKDGEFSWFSEAKTPFAVKRMVEKGLLFNIGDCLTKGPGGASSKFEYYHEIPQVRINNSGVSVLANGQPNWASILTAGATKGYESNAAELVTLYVRLIPTEFGLVPKTDATRKRLEIWRIQILNNQRIVSTEKMTNIHDWLPMVFACPNEDNLGLQVKSIAEGLLPFQDLANFMLNSFMDGTRKNIWDLLVYDPMVVDLSKIGNDVAARLPLAETGYGKNPNESIWHFNKNLETDALLNQLQGVLQLMEWNFPTRLMQQVADIDRAVKDQVAVVVQSAQRESWKMAKIMNDQAFMPLRFMMYSNIVQFQPAVTVVMPGGQNVDISPSQLRQKNLEFTLGEGLKDLDKMQMGIILREMLNTLLSSGASAEFDVPGLMTYMSALQGAKVDFTQFRLSPQQQMQKQAATAAGAQAGTNLANTHVPDPNADPAAAAGAPPGATVQ